MVATVAELNTLIDALAAALKVRRWAAQVTGTDVTIDAPGAGERAVVVRLYDGRLWTVTLRDRDGGQLDFESVVIRFDCVDDAHAVANYVAPALQAIWRRAYDVGRTVPVHGRRRR